MGINLFQNNYIDDSIERNKELQFCYEANAAIKLYEVVYKYTPLFFRPTFNDFFKVCSLRPNDINIIANSDIYFDAEALYNIQKAFMNHKNPNQLCLALTRYDMANGLPNFMNRADSQDVWAFMGKVPQLEGADFYIGGVAGCDNRIAKILENNGYNVVNPSIDIKTYHVHETNVRNYIDEKGNVKETIPPPYKLVPPCTLNSIFQ